MALNDPGCSSPGCIPAEEQASYSHHCWFSADAESSVITPWYKCCSTMYSYRHAAAFEGLKGDKENEPAL
jgi:hypothetical protein